MKLLFSTLLCLSIFTTSQVLAEKASNFSITPEIQTILSNASIAKQITSQDNNAKITLYKSNKTLSEGEMASEVLKINSNEKTLWLYNGYGLVFSKFDFLNNEQVILSICGLMSCSNQKLDTKQKTITYLGGGSYRVLNDKQVLLKSSKHYDNNGAFWVDKLVDYNGNLLEVIASDNKRFDCVPLKTIASGNNPKLTQAMDDCVYVNR